MMLISFISLDLSDLLVERFISVNYTDGSDSFWDLFIFERIIESTFFFIEFAKFCRN